jgi:hypothetical protein
MLDIEGGGCSYMDNVNAAQKLVDLPGKTVCEDYWQRLHMHTRRCFQDVCLGNVFIGSVFASGQYRLPSHGLDVPVYDAARRAVFERHS